MLDLEELALRNGEAADLPGVTDHDEIEIRPCVSAHPRGHRPAIHVVDVFLRKPPVLLFPRNSQRICILSELDDSELRAVGDFYPVLLRVEPDERPAVAVADERSSYRVERGCFHGYTSIV